MPDEALYTEDRVPPVDRVLGLRGRLGEDTIEFIKQNMRPTLRALKPNLPAHEYQILERTVSEFLALDQLKRGVFVALSFGYADLPLGQRFDVLFPVEAPQNAVPAPSVLRAVVNEWRPVAMDGIPRGHRTVGLFEFSQGIPEIVKGLPEVNYPTATAAPTILFLSSAETLALRRAQAGG